MRRVTQQDIVEATGFSSVTVSNALLGRGRMSAATRAAILAAARSLGYKPGHTMYRFADGRTGTLAFLTHPLAFQPPALLMAVAEETERLNRHLLYGLLPTHDRLHDSLPQIVHDWKVDGVVMLLCYDVPPAVHQEVAERKTPVVWLNSESPENCVIFNEYAAFHAATTRCLELGHTRIAYVTSSHFIGNYHHRERRRGYSEAMTAAGLQPWVDVMEDVSGLRVPTHLACTAQVSALLQRRPRPTALIAYNEILATAAVTAAVHAQLRVPEDLSICTVGIEPVTAGGCALTTYVQPWQRMGTVGVDAVLQIIAQGGKPIAPRHLDYLTPEGSSIAAAPS